MVRPATVRPKDDEGPTPAGAIEATLRAQEIALAGAGDPDDTAASVALGRLALQAIKRGDRDKAMEMVMSAAVFDPGWKKVFAVFVDEEIAQAGATINILPLDGESNGPVQNAGADAERSSQSARGQRESNKGHRGPD